ncbi:MAG: HAD family phosphatase [Candidatus Limiplasma sp.]|nr:HAD family phosphatase [Candidatus Limiplasma sp.]
MIRNIVFDMGMVLMNYNPLGACRAVTADEATARRVNEALFSNPEWPRMDEGTIEKEGMVKLAMEQLAEPALEPVLTRLLDEMPYNVLTPIPGMAAVVDWTLDAGFQVYLLSNAGWDVSRNRHIIPRIERFHGVMISVEEGLIKPNAAIYQRLTDRYGLKPEECLFIDDNPANIEAARRLGWQGIVFDGDVAALRGLLQGLKG